MPPKTDLIKGALKVAGILENLCVESAEDLIKALPEYLSVEVPSSITNVVIGIEQPGDTERDSLWIRKDTSGSYVGMYVYSQGQWRQIQPVPNEIFLISGDSRNPPAGYTLATDYVGLTVSQKDFLREKQHWNNDTPNTYYDLFYVVYTGF